ncbi:MAG: hypothetical protein P8100_10045 [bacterium]
MKRFDSKGMLIIPNPKQSNPLLKGEKILVVEKCYCPNGHNLMSQRAIFDGFSGIAFRATREGESGMVAISPVYGCKSRVSFDLDLKEGTIWHFHCPVCNEPLPFYKDCTCGGKVTVFFTTMYADYAHSFGICNRVGCYHSDIHYGQELLEQSMLESH